MPSWAEDAVADISEFWGHHVRQPQLAVSCGVDFEPSLAALKIIAFVVGC